MPDLPPAILVLVGAAGAVAGCLGALLGIGGGVFLVPFLHLVVGLPWPAAAGIGLMTVIGTSGVISAGTEARRLVNMRLGMLLQVPAGAGALAGGIVVALLPERILHVLFALVTAVIAAIMLVRLDHRGVVLDPTRDPGPFGGRYFEPGAGADVIYRPRRLHVGLIVSLVAGSISGTLGIGGGILQVPAMNTWCGVPMRVAASTSAVMIGITAAASAPIYYARGDILPPAAAAAVAGVVIGSRAGLWIGQRAGSRRLKLLMAGVLAAVSLSFIARAW